MKKKRKIKKILRPVAADSLKRIKKMIDKTAKHRILSQLELNIRMECMLFLLKVKVQVR